MVTNYYGMNEKSFIFIWMFGNNTYLCNVLKKKVTFMNATFLHILLCGLINLLEKPVGK